MDFIATNPTNSSNKPELDTLLDVTLPHVQTPSTLPPDTNSESGSESEEEVPYHIRWEDELGRRRRRQIQIQMQMQKPPAKVVRQTTYMVTEEGQLIYNGNPTGDRLQTSDDDMIFPIIDRAIV